MQTARITTNLQVSLMNFLIAESKKSKKTKRQIIEEALEWYQTEKLRKKLTTAGNKMAEDTKEMDEWLSIANNTYNL